MPLYMRFLLLPIFLLLSALPTAAIASPVGNAPVSASSASAPSDTLAPTFSLFPDWYTTPDRTPFRGPGLSAVAFLNPLFPLSPVNDRRLGFPLSFGVGGEWSFTKSNALRFTYGFARVDNPAPKGTTLSHFFSRHSVSLDHLWNLSNHYFGYDPARSWEFLLATGATFGWTHADPVPSKFQHIMSSLPSKTYFQGQLGFQIRKTLSPHLSAFVEPTYYFAQSDYDYYDNGADIDDGFSFKAGLQFRLYGPLHQTPWFDHLYSTTAPVSGATTPVSGATAPVSGATASIPGATVPGASAPVPSPSSKFLSHHSFFVQNLLGLNAANIKNWPQTDLDLSNYAHSFSVGQWLHPAWGYSIGFVDRQVLLDAKYSHNDLLRDRRTFRQTYLRLEGILNTLAFFDESSLGRLGIDLTAGVEVGSNRIFDRMTDKRKNAPSPSYTNSDQSIFPGATASVQFKYFLNAHTALVGESRYGYFDRRAAIFTPSIGLEYYSSPFRRFTTRRPSSHGTYHPTLNSKLFFEAEFGFNKHSNQQNSNIHVAPMAEFAMGLHLNDLYSVRLKEHLTYHRQRYMLKSIYRTANFHSQLSLDYMFDLSNYWMGVDSYRRFSIRPFAGPVYSARLLTKSDKLEGKHRLGFNFGVQHALNINPSFAITAEPRYLALINDMNHWSFGLGAVYTVPTSESYAATLRRGDGSSSASASSKHYLQALAGFQVMNAYRLIGVGEHGGFDLTYGHNLLPNIDLQATAFYQNFYQSYILHTQDHIYGLCLEAVADVLNIIWPDARVKGYALTAQVGGDFAYSRKHDRHIGPTVATQYRRRLGHTPLWWTVQARMQVRANTVPKSGVLLSTGLHYTL